MHRLLPNVEELTVSHIDIQGNPVHFEHVKYFYVQSKFAPTLNKLSFTRLELLRCAYSVEYFDGWLDFFRRNSNLSKLSIVLHQEGDRMIELTAEVPNLIEIIISAFRSFPADEIIQFIEGHPKLIKFNCLVEKIAEDDLESLRNRFESEWHIQCVDEKNNKKLILEKKNDDAIAYGQVIGI